MTNKENFNTKFYIFIVSVRNVVSSTLSENAQVSIDLGFVRLAGLDENLIRGLIKVIIYMKKLLDSD